MVDRRWEKAPLYYNKETKQIEIWVGGDDLLQDVIIFPTVQVDTLRVKCGEEYKLIDPNVVGSKGDKGDKGDSGDPGYTPIKGVDYSDGSPGTPGTPGYTPIKGIDYFDGATGSQGIPGISSYTIFVQALTSSPTDAQTVYFGMLPKAPTTTANISKIYIRKTGTIKGAEIYCYSGTAGTNEAWSLYIRVNNAADTLIATVSAAASERIFSNAALNIGVVAGDYIEIKGIQPTWATNPLTTIYGGYIYIEV